MFSPMRREHPKEGVPDGVVHVDGARGGGAEGTTWRECT